MTLSDCLALAHDFRCGARFHAIVAADHALHEAKLDADTEVEQAAAALVAWLDLELLAHRHDDAGLDAAMAAAETALMPHRGAMLLLDDEHYQALTAGRCVEPESWIGLPVELDEVVPAAAVVQALEALAAELAR